MRKIEVERKAIAKGEKKFKEENFLRGHEEIKRRKRITL